MVSVSKPTCRCWCCGFWAPARLHVCWVHCRRGAEGSAESARARWDGCGTARRPRGWVVGTEMTDCQWWVAGCSWALTGCRRSKIHARGCTRGYCPCTGRGCRWGGGPRPAEGCTCRAGDPGSSASLRLCWSPPPGAEAGVTGQHPARERQSSGNLPCDGDTDDEYEDPAGSSIAYSTVNKTYGRGGETYNVIIKIFNTKQIK